MLTRKLGNSDLDIAPVGFGAWALGGGGWQFGWGAQDDADWVAAIHHALELGVNWIDTAAVYGQSAAARFVFGAFHTPMQRGCAAGNNSLNQFRRRSEGWRYFARVEPSSRAGVDSTLAAG